MKSDLELKNDMLSELLWDPRVPEARVGVAGVTALAVEIEVIPPGSHQRSVTEIAAAVQHALSWNTAVPPQRIQVSVERGWVCRC